jgi:DnaK suppressor protein
MPDFREKLLQLRDELVSLADTNDLSSRTVDLDQSRLGRLSRMDALQSQAMAQAAGRRRGIMLQKIDAALRRIDTDDYGHCHECGEQINLKRLEFDPAATLCVSCAQKAER